MKKIYIIPALTDYSELCVDCFLDTGCVTQGDDIKDVEEYDSKSRSNLLPIVGTSDDEW